jgi:hypothetical protein
MQLRYTTEEILADHAYVQPNLLGTRRLHGGYDAEGVYRSPRTLNRWPAIEAWRKSLLNKGGELVDISTRIPSAPPYPNLAQMKFLLANGVTLPLWNKLTTTGIVEARGRPVATIVAPDFQPLVEEDISETATAHLNKGLLIAHGLDEGGDGSGEILAHDQMWYVVRDLVLGENAHLTPVMPEHPERAAAKEREMPQVPAPHETMIKRLIIMLMFEIRAEFAFAIALMRDPEVFAGRRAEADQAAAIVEQIRQDEASHVAYLQLVLSEIRAMRFKGAQGCVEGKTFIDPVLAKTIAWTSDYVPHIQANHELVERCLKPRADGSTMLAQFEALADDEISSCSVRRRHGDRALDDVEEAAVSDHVFDHKMVGATDERV